MTTGMSLRTDCRKVGMSKRGSRERISRYVTACSFSVSMLARMSAMRFTTSLSDVSMRSYAHPAQRCAAGRQPPRAGSWGNGGGGRSAHPDVCAEFLNLSGGGGAAQLGRHALVERALAEDLARLLPVCLLLPHLHQLRGQQPSLSAQEAARVRENTLEPTQRVAQRPSTCLRGVLARPQLHAFIMH